MGSGFYMIDIHAHLLPGLDDGPRTEDEALRMCELYVAEGVTTVVATPHMCDRRYDVAAEDVRRGVAELSEACQRRGLDLRILPGADVKLQPDLLRAVDAGDVLTIGDGGSHLLLELPLQTAPPIHGLVFELALRGIAPVLTHPERHLELVRKPQRLGELVGQGCLVQITAGSLLGWFGRGAKRAAQQFLKAGWVGAVATDAHSVSGHRRPALKLAAQRLSSLMGNDMARKLLCENPGTIIGAGRPGAPPGRLARAAEKRIGQRSSASSTAAR